MRAVAVAQVELVRAAEGPAVAAMVVYQILLALTHPEPLARLILAVAAEAVLGRREGEQEALVL